MSNLIIKMIVELGFLAYLINGNVCLKKTCFCDTKEVNELSIICNQTSQNMNPNMIINNNSVDIPRNYRLKLREKENLNLLKTDLFLVNSAS